MACEVIGEHDALLKKVIGIYLHSKLSAWLKNLRWVQSPALPVTCVELALDFEAFSGSRLPGDTLAEKGLEIGALMRAFNEVGLLRDRPAFVGRWRQGLRCLGASPMPGISHCPVFAGEPVTVMALNNIPASCQGREWREVKPNYGSPLAGRKQFSQKTKPKALTSAIAKYVNEIKRNRTLEEMRRAKGVYGSSTSAALPTHSVMLPPSAGKRDDNRPP